MSLSSSQEERFGAILQPIRDLARNWDIDIAHYLEEYLEDLEKIQITFDDGTTTMNFSEAALLIQGSAGVYAKKVEYLYGLVFQVLDLVTQKKKQKNKSGEGEEGDCGDDNGTDEDEQFLQLDDLEEVETAYMKELETSTNKSVQPIPQMPSCLIPLEDSQKGDNPICNNKGEIIGNYYDFIINTGRIGRDSGIALEPGDLLSTAALYLNNLQEFVEEDLTGCGRDDVGDVPEDVDMDNNPMDIFEGGDAESGDCGQADQNPPEDPPVVEQRPAGQVVSNGVRRSQRKKVTFARQEPTQVLDPWISLDPHDKGKAIEKALKKKIPYKLPSGLEDNTAKKRKRKDIKKELIPINEVVEKMFSHRSSFPKHPMKIPDFPELDEPFWKEYKLRDLIKKEEIKQLKKEQQLEEENVDDVEEGREDFPQDQFGDAGDDDFDDIPVVQLDTDIFGDDHRRRTLGYDTDNPTNFADDVTLSYEELVRKHVDQFLASAGEYAQVTDLSRKVSEWEDKIKPRLEEEEKHDAFDIHKYGSTILEQLVRGEKKSFKELVSGKPQYQICRLTLATLQLANVYNVELSVAPDKDGSIVDTLQVKLLSTKRHFEELEQYQAPSAKES